MRWARSLTPILGIHTHTHLAPLIHDPCQSPHRFKAVDPVNDIRGPHIELGSNL